MRILKQSHSVEKTRKGIPFGLFETSVSCKISKKLKGFFGPLDPLVTKKFRKSCTVPKKIQRGDLVVPSGFVSYVKNLVHEREDPLH